MKLVPRRAEMLSDRNARSQESLAGSSSQRSGQSGGLWAAACAQAGWAGLRQS